MHGHSFTGTAPRSDRHAAPPSSPRPRVHETVRSAVVSLDTRPGPGAYDSHGWGARPTPTRKRLSRSMHGTVSRARRRGPTGTRPLRRRRGRVCTKPYARPWFRWIPDPDRVATTRTAGAPVRRRLGRDYPGRCTAQFHGHGAAVRPARGPPSSPRPVCTKPYARLWFR
ncbi:unnamed protein product [Macrosiphum euphorbiae]|uniref:Uncharacterized protein n=1 Tax=Macrosiphum euphorbiae TaxID=13131 RepID=A0AAV0Y600_9HEMI|nr:unnamed protein product [Macrosiphum euphorbiae]